VVITDIPFWRHIVGHMARITTLIDYLKTRVHLTVIYGDIMTIMINKPWNKENTIRKNHLISNIT